MKPPKFSIDRLSEGGREAHVLRVAGEDLCQAIEHFLAMGALTPGGSNEGWAKRAIYAWRKIEPHPHMPEENVGAVGTIQSRKPCSKVGCGICAIYHEHGDGYRPPGADEIDPPACSPAEKMSGDHKTECMRRGGIWHCVPGCSLLFDASALVAESPAETTSDGSKDRG